jgi:hypothetical protein
LRFAPCALRRSEAIIRSEIGSSPLGSQSGLELTVTLKQTLYKTGTGGGPRVSVQ